MIKKNQPKQIRQILDANKDKLTTSYVLAEALVALHHDDCECAVQGAHAYVAIPPVLYTNGVTVRRPRLRHILAPCGRGWRRLLQGGVPQYCMIRLPKSNHIGTF